MNRETMIANWKNSLVEESPAGAVEIVDNLDAITGGACTCSCCSCKPNGGG